MDRLGGLIADAKSSCEHGALTASSAREFEQRQYSDGHCSDFDGRQNIDNISRISAEEIATERDQDLLSQLESFAQTTNQKPFSKNKPRGSI